MSTFVRASKRCCSGPFQGSSSGQADHEHQSPIRRASRSPPLRPGCGGYCPRTRRPQRRAMPLRIKKFPSSPSVARECGCTKSRFLKGHGFGLECRFSSSVHTRRIGHFGRRKRTMDRCCYGRLDKRSTSRKKQPTTESRRTSTVAQESRQSEGIVTLSRRGGVRR